jgi:kumamolisin
MPRICNAKGPEKMKTTTFAIGLCAAAIGFTTTFAHAAVSTTPASRASLAVTLKIHHAGELDALISSQTNPRSPLYGRFLSVAQYRAYFAPSPAEYAATQAALARAGFRIDRTYANRTLLDVSAPAAIAARTFGAGWGAHATIPNLLPYVGAAAANGANPAQTSIQRGSARQTPGVRDAGSGPDGGFGPNAIVRAFNFPVRHGWSGAGVKVADLIDGAASDTDIGVFLKAFGLTRTGPATTVVTVNGAGTDVFQADIDAEWIVAAAPAVRLYDYQVPYLSNQNIVDGYTQIVSDDAVDIVNTAFAACEDANVDLALAAGPILQQGAAQGISFNNIEFGGVDACGSGDALFPHTPSDSPDGLAVGGSNAIEDGNYNLLAQTGYASSGGGVSAIFPIYPEQRMLRGVRLSGRNDPDMVVASVVNGNGSSFYAAGSWAGGFLFINNAPISGLLASYKQHAHHRLGAFDRTLSALFGSNGYGWGLSDITQGCNGHIDGKPICAHPGYDLTTGIGAFTNATSFMALLK